ncbi:hypothetical protein [Rathayibacter soli]|uniref:hypothetical protein n=1 Tax=Rathayibacter soli TaxID=3144168 RepID=UPI0027E4ABCB|nr:hypothetical protein [Glaciibacter superstes]
MDALQDYHATRNRAGQRALQHTRAQAAISRTDEGTFAMRDILKHLVRSRKVSRRLGRLLEEN